MAIKLKEITLKNVKAFIQGYIRKWTLDFFQNRLEHILEQVEYRIDMVAEKSPECLMNGECKICHCATPALFYADKPCSNKETPCYGPMLNKQEWIKFKNHVSR